jgi:hypothetical protein
MILNRLFGTKHDFIDAFGRIFDRRSAERRIDKVIVNWKKLGYLSGINIDSMNLGAQGLRRDGENSGRNFE